MINDISLKTNLTIYSPTIRMDQPQYGSDLTTITSNKETINIH